jgi:hypothetical protein
VTAVPTLNLLSRPALLGLVYRALAGMADGGDAPLTLRRIEQLQAELTMLLQRQSELKATQGIAAEHAAKARKSAGQSQLDLRIFNESYVPPKRGFLKRLTPAERAQERKLAELEAIAAHEREQAEQLAERQQLVTSDLLLVESELKEARADRDALLGNFEEQLAAHVLELIAQARPDEAGDVLETARRDVRGSIAVGALLVLVELCAPPELNPAEARRMLASLEPLFAQAQDATPRALALLLRLAEGGRVTQSELGLLASGNFRSAALYRLYQLITVLAGGGVDPQDESPWAGTLRLCLPQQSTDDLLAAFDSEDTVRITLAAAGLLANDELAQLWDTDWAQDLPQRSSLIEQLSDPVPAWPVGLVTPWAAALSCLTLLALYMAEGGRSGQYGRWLQDSYGWPKDDLYWWMLATLKDDPALLKNATGSGAQLLRVPPA